MKKNGMSLIVLVITILVMIILAGVVIVSLAKNNPIEKSKEALFKADIIAFRDELNLSIANELALTNTLVKEDIDAAGKDMLKYIPSMTKKYIPKIQIQDGSLMYIGTDKKEEKWFNEVLGRESAYKVEKPAIKAGLTPIKWNASNAVVTTTDT
ncbi:MAG: hypothetical protein RR489_05575, partial [Clostridia bacterium]